MRPEARISGVIVQAMVVQQKARELILRHAIPLVMTSADPFTSHKIGLSVLIGCRARVNHVHSPAHTADAVSCNASRARL